MVALFFTSNILWGQLESSWSCIQSAARDGWDVKMPWWRCRSYSHIHDKRSTQRLNWLRGHHKSSLQAKGLESSCEKWGQVQWKRIWAIRHQIASHSKGFSSMSVTKAFSLRAYLCKKHQSLGFAVNIQLYVIKEILWLTSVFQCFERHHIQGMFAWCLLWGQIRSENIKQRDVKQI